MTRTSDSILTKREKHNQRIDARVRQAHNASRNIANHQAVHTTAAARGETAVEIDLFAQFDADGSGTLSKNELRRALQSVKKELMRIDPDCVAPFNEELAALDADGDGEIELHEFMTGIPERLQKALRAAGPKLLATQDGITGKKHSLAVHFQKADERGKEARVWQAQVDAKQKVRHQYDASSHLSAAQAGTIAVEVDLFREFDIDGSVLRKHSDLVRLVVQTVVQGTLTGKELRKALGHVRTKIKHATKADLPGMKIMMAKLDEDGDGNITLAEWQAKLPDELRDALRALGPSAVLSDRTTATALGKGASAGRGKIAMKDERGKDLAMHRAAVSKTRSSRKMHDASFHVKAAKKGEKAVEIDIFHQFDNDGSGTLSRRELRRALNGIKKHLDPVAVAQMAGILGKLDEDGDGEVNIVEWDAKLPEDLRRAIRKAGEKLTAVQLSGKALGAKGSVHIATERARQKEIEDHSKRVAAAKVAAKKSGLGLISEHLRAVHSGKASAESILFRYYDDDNSGTLTKRELRRAMAGMQIDPGTVNELLASWDGDDDGSVSYVEWMAEIKDKPELQAALTRKAEQLSSRASRLASQNGQAAHHMATADRSIEYTARKPAHSDIWAFRATSPTLRRVIERERAEDAPDGLVGKWSKPWEQPHRADWSNQMGLAAKEPMGGWKMADGVQRFMATNRVITDFRTSSMQLRMALGELGTKGSASGFHPGGLRHAASLHINAGSRSPRSVRMLGISSARLQGTPLRTAIDAAHCGAQLPIVSHRQPITPAGQATHLVPAPPGPTSKSPRSRNDKKSKFSFSSSRGTVFRKTPYYIK